MKKRETTQSPRWLLQYTYWGYPKVSIHGSYADAERAGSQLRAPWIIGKQIVGPIYFEVPA